ncbi:hypothetical protein AB0L59_28480 [Streptomyces sp. NPDC052109]
MRRSSPPASVLAPGIAGDAFGMAGDAFGFVDLAIVCLLLFAVGGHS